MYIVDDEYQFENLVFRHLTLEDVSHRYVNWLNDPEINKYLESRHSVQTIESVKSFVEYCNNSSSDALFGVFLDNLSDNKSNHIGNVKVGLINRYHQTGELGILIGEKQIWGRGFGEKIILGVCLIAKTYMGLRKLTAGCYGRNAGSYKVFTRAGFKVVGERKNHVITDYGYDSIFLFDKEL